MVERRRSIIFRRFCARGIRLRKERGRTSPAPLPALFSFPISPPETGKRFADACVPASAPARRWWAGRVLRI